MIAGDVSRNVCDGGVRCLEVYSRKPAQFSHAQSVLGQFLAGPIILAGQAGPEPCDGEFPRQLTAHAARCQRGS